MDANDPEVYASSLTTAESNVIVSKVISRSHHHWQQEDPRTHSPS